MEQIIVLHGSKDESRNEILADRLDALMGEELDYSVAFIESRERGVDQVIEKLTREGHHHFNIIPVLFFSASHYCRDIPRALDKVKERHDVEWALAPVLSHHPLMQHFIEKRISELPRWGAVMVMAHGNTDYKAADHEMEDLLSRLETNRPIFPGMLKGRLSLDGVLPELGAQHDVLHVIPIALEDGFLTSKMKEAVMEHAKGMSVSFTAAVNFDPMLKGIIMDHMKSGEHGSRI
ncbi:sirohydrochlorin chelatase [Salinicoccus hispanicus]|uniref:Sirohydrochlorin chelatase n=1 Tax=Salinicoccus hispanicus TaxID=157225 RepID=A0A6N8TVA2_9STAP|nr:CbiX/SirB N-terminal domain-containing protein [Salinicoccus hispanicus]MXQ49838.1 hypothetical protein [Salinicoccus hispanicus]